MMNTENLIKKYKRLIMICNMQIDTAENMLESSNKISQRRMLNEEIHFVSKEMRIYKTFIEELKQLK